eukprot:3202140-Pleurochrysis_carterae.AAC.1
MAERAAAARTRTTERTAASSTRLISCAISVFIRLMMNLISETMYAAVSNESVIACVCRVAFLLAKLEPRAEIQRLMTPAQVL